MGPPGQRRRRRRGDSCTLATFQEVYSLELGVLGQGAGGQVLPCSRRAGGEALAVKVVQPGAGGRARVLREVELAARCCHPGVVRLLEYFEEGDAFLLVFERMEGNLYQRLSRR